MGISLVMYGRLEEADPLIESLSQDKDAILRRYEQDIVFLVSIFKGKLKLYSNKAHAHRGK